MSCHRQKLIILLIGLISIISCSTAPISTAGDIIQPQPQTKSSGVSMRLLWTVSEYRLGANAVWVKEEASKLLFKPLDIDANSITFDGKKCSNVSFKKEIVNTKDYLDNFFHTTPQALGVQGETVQVIKTTCNLPGFGEYLRLKDMRLVIQIKGIFFYLTPAMNY
jgi:hypothetical protein